MEIRQPARKTVQTVVSGRSDFNNFNNVILRSNVLGRKTVLNYSCSAAMKFLNVSVPYVCFYESIINNLMPKQQ
jgi:hypothetical protein